MEMAVSSKGLALDDEDDECDGRALLLCGCMFAFFCKQAN